MRISCLPLRSRTTSFGNILIYKVTSRELRKITFWAVNNFGECILCDAIIRKYFTILDLKSLGSLPVLGEITKIIEVTTSAILFACAAKIFHHVQWIMSHYRSKGRISWIYDVTYSNTTLFQNLRYKILLGLSYDMKINKCFSYI